MNKKNYVALHNHTHYSTLDGYATVDEYIKAAVANGMEGIGLADHGTASGLYKFITRAQKAGITPVPGIEFYVAPENQEGAKVQGPIYYGEGGVKAPEYDVSNGAYTHMTVFAYNNVGLSNLFKLTSLSWKPENFYFKPRIDTNMLAEHCEGLIVTTGCPSSEVNRRFLLGQDDKAYEYASRLKAIFGENLYVEIMDHSMENEELERILMPKLIELSRKLDIPLIATNDSHYAFQGDAKAHERILAVATKSDMDQLPFYEGGSRFAFSTEEYYIKSYDEMKKLYPEEVAEEALANTVELMNKCKGITLDYDPHLRPEIEIPEGYSAPTYLQKLIYDGFKLKRSHETKEVQAESVKRIQEEFTVLHSNDFIDYFLVVHDYIDYAHRNNIGVGAGRGCFVPGSKVKSNQGALRNIEDIKIGDKVQTHDTTYQLVEDVFTYDVVDEDMIKLTLSNGKVIESTADHLIFNKETGFIKAEDLKVGDTVLGPKGRREKYTIGCDNCKKTLTVDKQEYDRRVDSIEYYSDPEKLEELANIGNGNYKSGYFTSYQQDEKQIYYASSYELKALTILETDSTVKEFGRCKRRLKYDKPSTGLKHNYLPDIEVVDRDGNIKIIEVKAKWQLQEEDTASKLAQAKEQFDNMGIEFEIWTEDTFKELNDDWHNDIEVVSVEKFKYTGEVHDLQVANVHNYNVEGITVHNSVGGSEIAYLLDISNTDPIRFDLLFERFLSPGRGSLYQIEYMSGDVEEVAVSAKKLVHRDGKEPEVIYVHELYPGDLITHGDGKEVIKKVFVKVPGSAPDVDTDFHTQRREEVIQYCVAKYGEENVSNIVTFGTFKAKSAFKAIAKVYNVPYARSNTISQLIPGGPGVDVSLAELMDPTSRWYNEAEDFRRMVENDSVLAEVVEIASALDGRISDTSVHPCGVIIANQPLSNVAPMMIRQDDNKLVSQWEYPELEALGLIKMDFLGLELIDTVQQAVENIELTNAGAEREEDKLVVPDMREIILGPMDDPKTYETLQNGHTVGIFQLGNSGVKDFLTKIKPDNFMEIANTTALYRPGPLNMGSHMQYANRKHGLEEVSYIHEDFKGTIVQEILDETYGVLVFQEQTMRIAGRYAGMTPYETDQLRSAIGKKKMDVMMRMKPMFIDGCMAQGASKEASTRLWDMIEAFGEYGFNKCAWGETLISTPKYGKIRLNKLYKMQEKNPEESIEVYSMYEDGSIKPHKVKEVSYSGKKPVYEIITESGKRIKITKEHRMLTTNGYGTIEDGKLAVGKELLVDNEWSKRLSPETIQTKKDTMAAVNRTPEMREAAKKRMAEYQSTLTFDDRSAHQSKISENSNRHEVCLPIGRAKLAELRKDPEWSAQFAKSCEDARQRKYESGEYKGVGKPTKLSNGVWCDSMIEALAGEYLISRGVDFETHKSLISETTGTSKICDFYADGLYFEMDGLNRGEEYFRKEKYGDIPFVYMTPYNYKDVIDEALMNHHIENGDVIVEIIEPKETSTGKQWTSETYDIEMEDNGPSNFIAEGLVSHNSHSVSYAINIYETVYLKTHYPREFMAALIQQGFGNPNKVRLYIQEAVRMGLKLGHVDINTSQVQMASTGVNKTSQFDIVFGFSGVKQTNDALGHAIVEERNKNGKYKSVADFVKRISTKVPLTAAPLSSLAIAGAFDTFGVSRKLVAEKARMLISSGEPTINKGTSLFDMLGGGSSIADVAESIELTGDEYDYNELIKLEADRIGMFVSGHPIARLGHIAKRFNPKKMSDVLATGGTRETFKVLGTITHKIEKSTKAGNKSIAILMDDGSTTNTTYLPREMTKRIEKGEEIARLARARERGTKLKVTKRSERLLELVRDASIEAMEPIELNEPYLFTVTTRGWGEEVSIQVLDVEKLITAPDGSLPFELNVPNQGIGTKVKEAVKKFKSKKGAYVKINHPNGDFELIETRVKLSIDFIIAMEQIVGKENIVTEGI